MTSDLYDIKALMQLRLKIPGAQFLDENARGFVDAALVRVGCHEVVKLKDCFSKGYDCWVRLPGSEPVMHKTNATENEAISFLMNALGNAALKAERDQKGEARK